MLRQFRYLLADIILGHDLRSRTAFGASCIAYGMRMADAEQMRWTTQDGRTYAAADCTLHDTPMLAGPVKERPVMRCVICTNLFRADPDTACPNCGSRDVVLM